MLRCSISPIHPQLNFSFRYQAGYLISIPMNQFEGKGHRWRLLTRITPEDGDQRPVYLVAGYRLPEVPKTKVEFQVGGGYLLGEGAYQVRQVLLDDAGRTCRHDWHVQVRPARGEGKIRVAMPPNTVWDVALRGSHMAPAAVPDDAAPVRLTILLHAAPAFARRLRLRQNDILMMLASVASILERVPTTQVRLVAFNLEQQKELYRKDGFVLRDIPAVADAMTRVELGLVDVKVLQNRLGHVDTIADLVNQEMSAESLADVVLFLGPASRFFERVTQDALVAPPAHGPQWAFLQLAPIFRGGGRGPMAVTTSSLPDSISRTVSKLGGKTTLIHSPGDLAKAIDRLEKMARTAQSASASGGIQ
jgi:hypothetical protein